MINSRLSQMSLDSWNRTHAAAAHTHILIRWTRRGSKNSNLIFTSWKLKSFLSALNRCRRHFSVVPSRRMQIIVYLVLGELYLPCLRRAKNFISSLTHSTFDSRSKKPPCPRMANKNTIDFSVVSFARTVDSVWCFFTLSSGWQTSMQTRHTHSMQRGWIDGNITFVPTFSTWRIELTKQHIR